MCGGCQALKETLTRLEVPFDEIDVRHLSHNQEMEIMVSLRITNWPGKAEFFWDDSAGRMRPLLQAPILEDRGFALWSSFLLPDGREVLPQVVEVLELMAKQNP